MAGYFEPGYTDPSRGTIGTILSSMMGPQAPERRRMAGEVDLEGNPIGTPGTDTAGEDDSGNLKVPGGNEVLVGLPKDQDGKQELPDVKTGLPAGASNYQTLPDGTIVIDNPLTGRPEIIRPQANPNKPPPGTLEEIEARQKLVDSQNTAQSAINAANIAAQKAIEDARNQLTQLQLSNQKDIARMELDFKTQDGALNRAFQKEFQGIQNDFAMKMQNAQTDAELLQLKEELRGRMDELRAQLEAKREELKQQYAYQYQELQKKYDYQNKQLSAEVDYRNAQLAQEGRLGERGLDIQSQLGNRQYDVQSQLGNRQYDVEQQLGLGNLALRGTQEANRESDFTRQLAEKAAVDAVQGMLPQLVLAIQEKMRNSPAIGGSYLPAAKIAAPNDMLVPVRTGG